MSGKRIFVSHVINSQIEGYQSFVDNLCKLLVEANHNPLTSGEAQSMDDDKLAAVCSDLDGAIILLDLDYIKSNRNLTEFVLFESWAPDMKVLVKIADILNEDRREMMSFWTSEIASGNITVSKPNLMRVMSAFNSANIKAEALNVADVASSILMAVHDFPSDTSAGAIVGKVLGGDESPMEAVDGAIEEMEESGSEPEVSRSGEPGKRGGGAPPPPPPPTPQSGNSDKVEFGIFTQDVITPGDQFIIDVWAYLTSQYQDVVAMAKDMDMGKVLKRKPGVSISTGAVVTVQVTMKGMTIDEPVDSFVWDGESTNVSFIVEVPEDARKGPYPGKVSVMIEGLPIARIPFILKVEGSVEQEQIQKQEVKSDIPRTAFASYSSANRIEVERAIQGMQSILPELQVFLDVNNLRSGAGGWLPQLQKNVPTKDKFFLFWSAEAAASKWVRMEWELALAERGLDYIQPVPLIDPREAPPPPELGDLHFNDTHLAQIHYEKYIKSKNS